MENVVIQHLELLHPVSSVFRTPFTEVQTFGDPWFPVAFLGHDGAKNIASHSFSQFFHVHMIAISFDRGIFRLGSLLG